MNTLVTIVSEIRLIATVGCSEIMVLIEKLSICRALPHYSEGQKEVLSYKFVWPKKRKLHKDRNNAKLLAVVVRTVSKYIS